MTKRFRASRRPPWTCTDSAGVLPRTVWPTRRMARIAARLLNKGTTRHTDRKDRSRLTPLYFWEVRRVAKEDFNG